MNILEILTHIFRKTRIIVDEDLHFVNREMDLWLESKGYTRPLQPYERITLKRKKIRKEDIYKPRVILSIKPEPDFFLSSNPAVMA